MLLFAQCEEAYMCMDGCVCDFSDSDLDSNGMDIARACRSSCQALAMLIRACTVCKSR